MIRKNRIREFVRLKLTDITDAADRVYNTRFLTLSQMPALIVATPSEILDLGRSLKIRLEVHGFIAAEDDSTLGERVDALEEQVRAALYRFWEDLGDFAGTYVGSETRFNVDAERPHVLTKIVYELETVDDE